jgi:hypothetical protein
MRFFPLLIITASLALGADDLDHLRDRQDRAGLDARAASLHQEAEKKPADPNGWYRAAIAYSYVAEVAMEVKDKAGAQRAAEAGVADADKAIELNGKNADYYRVLGTLCGQIIPANPIAGILTYGKRAKEALDKSIEMDPKSARAFVAHGVGYYYLPANFGGGPDNAIKDFKQASRWIRSLPMRTCGWGLRLRSNTRMRRRARSWRKPCNSIPTAPGRKISWKRRRRSDGFGCPRGS